MTKISGELFDLTVYHEKMTQKFNMMEEIARNEKI